MKSDLISILAFRSKKYYNILGRKEGKEGGIKRGRKKELRYGRKNFPKQNFPRIFHMFLRSTKVNQILLYFHISSTSLDIRQEF